MAHLSPRKAGARRARDRDVWSSTSESRLGQRSCVMAREGKSRHSVLCRLSTAHAAAYLGWVRDDEECQPEHRPTVWGAGDE